MRAVFFEDSAALIGLAVAASGLLLSRIFGTSVPDSLASLMIEILLASTAIGVARPFADFLVGRSIAPPLLEEILAIVESDAAVEEVLTFRAIYSGPEEVLVMAKIHPTVHINSEQLSQRMDTLDHKIRLAFPFVADVFIDVTANHIRAYIPINKESSGLCTRDRKSILSIGVDQRWQSSLAICYGGHRSC